MCPWPAVDVGKPGQHILQPGNIYSAWTVVNHRLFAARATADRLGATTSVMLGEQELPTSGFVVHKFWADRILPGKKIWEIRGESSKKRCRVVRSQIISGDVMMMDCISVGHWDGRKWKAPKNQDDFLWSPGNMEKHCVEEEMTLTYKNEYAWVLQDPQRSKRLVPFESFARPVTWVKTQKPYISMPAVEASSEQPPQTPPRGGLRRPSLFVVPSPEHACAFSLSRVSFSVSRRILDPPLLFQPWS